MKKGNVKINLKKDEIIITFAEEGTQEEIVLELTEKLEELKKLYKNEKTPIYINGKVLNEEEMLEIEKIIKEKIKVEINFNNPKELGLHAIKRSFETNIEISKTRFVRTSLRSGQKVEYEGSLVIIGDVNGGAEVIAGENIVVLGTLRGLVHAGAKGNRSATVSVENLEAPQIRIADVLKEVEKKEEDIHKNVYITIKNNEINIE